MPGFMPGIHGFFSKESQARWMNCADPSAVQPSSFDLVASF
jgi:hypothetical protein